MTVMEHEPNAYVQVTAERAVLDCNAIVLCKEKAFIQTKVSQSQINFVIGRTACSTYVFTDLF